MIQQTNPAIRVADLMERVRSEAAAMRAKFQSSKKRIAGIEFDALTCDRDPAVQSQLIAFVDDAAKNSAPRETVPKRFNRFPFVMFRPVFRFLLRANNYALKDQRHVNYATEAAVRLLISENDRLATELKRISAVLDDRTRALATRYDELNTRIEFTDEINKSALDAASVVARLEPLERYSSKLDSELVLLGERVLGCENALTLNAARIDPLELLRTDIDAGAAKIATLDKVITETRVCVAAAVQRIDALEVAAPIHRLALLEQVGSGPRLAALEGAMTTNASRIDRLEADRLDSAEARLDRAELATQIDRLREHMLRSDAAIRADLTAQQAFVLAQSSLGDASAIHVPDASIAKNARSYDHILLELADHFRSDAAVLSAHHREYLDLLQRATVVDENHPVVDVGCGRGEWLSFLRQHDISSKGIETNEELVQRASSDKLIAELGDGVDVLRGYAPESVGAVTAFHLVEHLPFGRLIELIDQALRVLRPGGMLIFETPDPANLVVGACNFWLDPTHIRPLPKLLAQFLVEQRGFADVTILELTPNTGARLPDINQLTERFNDFVYGPQEYAVVARRPL